MTIISRQDNQTHVQYNDKYYVVSDNGMETLIFPSNTQGDITNWLEVGGGRGYTLDEVLEDFANILHPF